MKTGFCHIRHSLFKKSPDTTGDKNISDFAIIIGNKNYSSWSLRGWLALKQAAVDFEEVMVVLYQPETPAELKKHSPSGLVPVLKTPHGDIWDSLAICEYLAEAFPEAGLWPVDTAARAHARTVSAEMHSRFSRLRALMPMDLRSKWPMPDSDENLNVDISRIDAIWQECRQRFGQGGPFLYGNFGIADCMFAPVASRFATYGTPVSHSSQDYINAVLDWPAMVEWTATARDEPWTNTRQPPA